jgi:hypothetical protein
VVTESLFRGQAISERQYNVTIERLRGKLLPICANFSDIITENLQSDQRYKVNGRWSYRNLCEFLNDTKCIHSEALRGELSAIIPLEHQKPALRVYRPLASQKLGGFGGFWNNQVRGEPSDVRPEKSHWRHITQ